MAIPHITVCICTFKRPAMLERLLNTLTQQKTEGSFTYSIVVADNDQSRSAEPVVTSFAKRSAVEATYASEPRQNIALARNKTIEHAEGDYIAFIDDDEFPDDAWLITLLNSCEKFKAAGILGPVKPHFETPPPSWVLKGRFCERPEPPTGTVMAWEKCRTGNVLFRQNILKGDRAPFRPQFGTGGEDKDFFMQMSERGNVFIWCNEAVAYETVPPDRWTRKYMTKRAMLRGRNVLKQPNGKIKLVATSLFAVPAYLIVMPFALARGQHIFMNYCIRFFDHLGRLLTCVGINPVRER